jgi:hypothetical protein
MTLPGFQAHPVARIGGEILHSSSIKVPEPVTITWLKASTYTWRFACGKYLHAGIYIMCSKIRTVVSKILFFVARKRLA